jgi:hypothetical protein
MHVGEAESTDRWFGVYRSQGCRTLTESEWALAQTIVRRERRRIAMGALAMLLPPAHFVLCLLFGSNALAFVGGVVAYGLLIVGLIAILDGANRLAQMRLVLPDDLVERFVGCARAGEHHDAVTQRHIRRGVLRTGVQHELLVLRRTGTLIAVDNVVPQRFSRSGIAVTALLRTTPGPFDSWELWELEGIAERMRRTAKRSVLTPVVAGVTAGLFAQSFAAPPDSGLPSFVPAAVVIGLTAGCLMYASGLFRAWRRAARLLADAPAGTILVAHTTRLAATGFPWTVADAPCPERLACGGLADRKLRRHVVLADGRRPVTF